MTSWNVEGDKACAECNEEPEVRNEMPEVVTQYCLRPAYNSQYPDLYSFLRSFI